MKIIFYLNVNFLKNKSVLVLETHIWHTYELPQTVAASTGPAQICTRWGPRAKERSGHMPSSLTHKLSPTASHLQMKN